MIYNSPKIVCINPNQSLELGLLNLEEFALFSGLSQKREIEKKAALYVVRKMLSNDQVEIQYHQNGRPYLHNGIKISVSHAYDKLAVLFSHNGKEVGVDIEKVRDKILKVKEKFLSQAELKDLENASLQKYTLYWAVKEAVYKACHIEGLAFAERIAVESFVYSEAGGTIYALLKNTGSEKKYTLHYQILNGYVLVYTDNGSE